MEAGMILYCKICGKEIQRRKRKDGRDESITQYRNRKTCGVKTKCFGANISLKKRARDKNKPVIKQLTAADLWLRGAA